ncbi:DUF6479 family protein [Streptomyces rubiginosohelvolus]|uniref:DUF6479 family protein n=2 Tax=Streptomyces rubiginosohelvolus TaxID=67362 RepID=UPI0036E88B20
MDAMVRGTGQESLIAAPEWAAGTVPFIVGLLVVALLIGAVVWRTRSGKRRASRPQEQPSHSSRPRQAPQKPRPADDFGGPGERLSPHEMRGYGNQGKPTDSDGE